MKTLKKIVGWCILLSAFLIMTAATAGELGGFARALAHWVALFAAGWVLFKALTWITDD